MTARAEFDVGPLSWVKGEIDHAIEHAQEALRAFAANSADPAQLKSSQTHLHQAHGALSIVGLEGITRVSEELGYGQLSSFTRWFISQFQKTPSEWRRRIHTGRSLIEKSRDRR